MAWMQPFPESKITGQFGTRSAFRIRNGLGPHRGTDWAMPNKTPIPAITSGTIALVQRSKVLGWCIVQTAWWNGKTHYIGYAHLAEKPVLKKGDKIEMGDTIALLGNTGSASSGPHLHATLSSSVKGVFYGQVYDLYKAIRENEGPGPEENVEVKLVPKNGNVVVQLTGVPVGSKLRLRKDGKSVWFKTIKADKVQNKGVSLTASHVLALELDGREFWRETVKKGIKEAKVTKPASKKPVAPAPAPTPVEKKPEPASSPTGYRVQPGDTLASIAAKHNFNLSELAKHNNIANVNLIRIGQEIKFPEAKPEPKVCETCKRPL